MIMNKMAYLILKKNIRDAVPEDKRENFDLVFESKEKNVAVALVLSLFFGTLGTDRFYIGRIILGILKLITLGGLGVWTIIDWFLIMRAARSRNIEIATEASKNI